MNKSPKIPIQNIYYMMCYSWDLLEKSDKTIVGSEKFDNIYHLFARVYSSEVKSIIKRGIHRYYMIERESCATLKGKINISESMKQLTFIKGRMICEYHNFSDDILLNQIVKTTITMLLKVPQLDRTLKKTLVNLRVHFFDIKEIYFTKELFSSIRYNQNNYHYKMLINISNLIYQGLITNETGNKILFSDFIRDKQMEKLYEKFVLKFYQYHLDKSIYCVNSKKIKWILEQYDNQEDLKLLPEMQTDIVITNKCTKNKIIIDTKYYSKTLVTSNWSDTERVKSAHLYQMFAYLKNSDCEKKIKGVVLYPTVQKSVDTTFPILGATIDIKTLNLNTDWSDIEVRLLSIIHNF